MDTLREIIIDTLQEIIIGYIARDHHRYITRDHHRYITRDHHRIHCKRSSEKKTQKNHVFAACSINGTFFAKRIIFNFKTIVLVSRTSYEYFRWLRQMEVHQIGLLVMFYRIVYH